jgi:hypothetical protein
LPLSVPSDSTQALSRLWVLFDKRLPFLLRPDEQLLLCRELLLF